MSPSLRVSCSTCAHACVCACLVFYVCMCARGCARTDGWMDGPELHPFASLCHASPLRHGSSNAALPALLEGIANRLTHCGHSMSDVYGPRDSSTFLCSVIGISSAASVPPFVFSCQSLQARYCQAAPLGAENEVHAVCAQGTSDHPTPHVTAGGLLDHCWRRRCPAPICSEGWAKLLFSFLFLFLWIFVPDSDTLDVKPVPSWMCITPCLSLLPCPWGRFGPGAP